MPLIPHKSSHAVVTSQGEPQSWLGQYCEPQHPWGYTVKSLCLMPKMPSWEKVLVSNWRLNA